MRIPALPLPLRVVGALTATALLTGPASIDFVVHAQSSSSTPILALGPSHDSGSSAVTDIRAVPGDSARLFVVLRDGRVRILRNFSSGSGGLYDLTPFLDIRSRAYDGCGECGLLGLAFHPDYANNGCFYVNYSRRNIDACINGQDCPDTVIARYSISSGDPDVADINSETDLLVVPQDYRNHNGGQIQFLPGTTYLYIGMGDGGSGGDPQQRSQSPDTLLGKMLRFDVGADGLSWTPAGSPNLGSPPFDPSVWAYGLRNPWRFSFDSANGDLYIADVGQGSREEIDYTPATSSSSSGGENYGWRYCEGFNGYRDGATNSQCSVSGTSPTSDYVAPAFDYVRSDPGSGDPYGRSVTGGYVYRGSDFPLLHGVYLYADYTGDWIRGAIYDDDSGIGGSWIKTHTNVVGLNGPTTFGEDANGELYVGTSTGVVRRILETTISEPTSHPTADPTDSPTVSPTTVAPTVSLTTQSPTGSPEAKPTITDAPTTSPTTDEEPTVNPTTISPTESPITESTTGSPTAGSPTVGPMVSPTTSTPTRVPISLGVSCPATPDKTRTLLSDLTLHYSIVEDPTNPDLGGILCAKLVLDRLAWVAFGRQPAMGGMNGDVVIGHFVDGAPVLKKYFLEGIGRDPAELAPYRQTLMDASLVQDAVNNTTTLTFTKFLVEEGELPWSLNGTNRILFAAGASFFPDPNLLENHEVDARGADVLDSYTLSPTESPVTAAPTGSPTTAGPTMRPTTGEPTDRPSTVAPTTMPTESPTTESPSVSPSKVPTAVPTASPTTGPTTAMPTSSPLTQAPTNPPTDPPVTPSPTVAPIPDPTNSATLQQLICSFSWAFLCWFGWCAYV